jgi:hypothetical protein
MKEHLWNLVNLDQDQGTNISAFDEEVNARVIEGWSSYKHHDNQAQIQGFGNHHYFN